MHIEHATRRLRQQLGLQDVPVRDDDADIGPQIAETIEERPTGWFFGLQNGELFGFRDLLDRRRNQLRTGAALRCIGLCDDGDDVEAFAEQRA